MRILENRRTFRLFTAGSALVATMLLIMSLSCGGKTEQGQGHGQNAGCDEYWNGQLDSWMEYAAVLDVPLVEEGERSLLEKYKELLDALPERYDSERTREYAAALTAISGHLANDEEIAELADWGLQSGRFESIMRALPNEPQPSSMGEREFLAAFLAVLFHTTEATLSPNSSGEELEHAWGVAGGILHRFDDYIDMWEQDGGGPEEVAEARQLSEAWRERLYILSLECPNVPGFGLRERVQF